MNALTVLLTSLMGLFSAVGAVPDEAIETGIRDQVNQVETLAVRTDMATNHQLLRGEIDRLRIAARGLYPLADVRIDTLDVETDVIDVNVDELRKGDLVWDQPLQAAVNFVVTQADVEQALRSPLVIEQLEAMNVELFGGIVGGMTQATLSDPQIRFLGNDRILLGATLTQDETGEQLEVEFITGMAIAQGTQLQFVEPALTTNGVAFPPELIAQLLDGFSQQYTLKMLEAQGITARLLALEITEDAVQVASFVRLESVDDEDY